MLGELGDIQATLHVEVRRAQNLAAPEGAGEFKPYVRLRFNHVERETDYIPGPDPVWEDAAFEFACSNVNLSRSKLVAEVWNWHLDQDHELVGHVEVPIQSLVPHEHEVAYAMKDPKADSEAGKLGLVLYFTQAAPRLFEVPQNNMYSELAKPEPEPEPEAKRCAFPAHAARRRALTRAVVAPPRPVPAGVRSSPSSSSSSPSSASSSSSTRGHQMSPSLCAPRTALGPAARASRAAQPTRASPPPVFARASHRQANAQRECLL